MTDSKHKHELFNDVKPDLLVLPFPENIHWNFQQVLFVDCGSSLIQLKKALPAMGIKCWPLERYFCEGETETVILSGKFTPSSVSSPTLYLLL
jgi:hypothetical protein